MFLFSPSRYLEELEKFRPEIATICRKAFTDCTKDSMFIRVNADMFASSPSDSIDYAIMENTSEAAVVPLEAGWSDIGSWETLWDAREKDENENVFQGDVFTVDTNCSYINAESRLVATVGVSDLVIVETKDAVLIANKGDAQNVKKLADLLSSKDREELLNHREVHRPWGMYDSIDRGPRYQVKRITVKPGAKLSIQMHHHRAEHWIVVSGTAKVTRGKETYLVTENQSTYIPVGETHTLENPGKIPLEVIEVQSGSYLGEDDIVRLQDDYVRS